MLDARDKPEGPAQIYFIILFFPVVNWASLLKHQDLPPSVE